MPRYSEMAKHKNDYIEKLEAMIDKTSVRFVLECIAEMCELKAEHVAVNWQDEHTARVWSRAAAYVEKAAQTRAVLDVSE
jgi:hypothetical protein